MKQTGKKIIGSLTKLTVKDANKVRAGAKGRHERKVKHY